MARLPLEYFVTLAGMDAEARIVRGEESVNTWSRFEARFAIPSESPLEPEDVVGSTAVLRIARQGAERAIQLVVADIERSATPTGAAYASEVRVILESRLGRLRHRQDIRVFRDMDYPSIAEKVLGAHGVAVSRSLAASYPKRPYTVQFRETDLAFASRLLEDEGIGYFVRDDGGVTFFDNTAAYQELATLPFRHAAGFVHEEDAILEIGERTVLGPSAITLGDFDFEKPSRPVRGVAATGLSGGSEWYDFPARRTAPGEASAKAKNQNEALAANRTRLVGRTNAGRIHLGAVLDVIGGPAGFEGGAFAVASVTHDFDRAREAATLVFSAVPSSAVLRPEPETPWPTIAGPLCGFVTGDGDDIHTDAWGRVKIHFPWDRLQPKNGSCSHWIPTLQDNTGHSVAIPRVGWEMLLHFVEGNPDEPVILGRVFNPLDPLHAVLPGNKTLTALRSLTSPRIPGDPRPNAIILDDLRKEETITMTASKDRNVVVAHDKTENTDRDDDRTIERNETITVGVDRKVSVAAESAHKVCVDQTETIGHDHHRKVDKGQTESILGNRSLTIGASHTRRVGETDTTDVKEVLSETIGAVLLEASVKDNTRTASVAAVTLVGGATLDVAKGVISHTTGSDRTDMTGIIRMTKAGKRIAKDCSGDRTTTVGASMKITAGTIGSLSGEEELEITAGSAKLTGSKKITLKVGETKIVMEKGEIVFDTKGPILISARGASNIKTGESKQNA